MKSHMNGVVVYVFEKCIQNCARESSSERSHYRLGNRWADAVIPE
jgi:hypothetical protein